MPEIKSAIIYTDVVGYSKLTGENQELALELLAEHDKILYQYTKHYDGKIIKKTGDGICALFNKSDQAIRCSIDIQKDLNKRNKLNTKEREVQIRIGIHYDTLIKKKDDVYGDGIIIAKSIEAVAPHGGIAISQSVNDLIKNINDIYSREYIQIDVNNNKIHLYEIYPNLLNWYINEKNQNSNIVDSKVTYKDAHFHIHKSDYSTALKYACLSLQNAKDIEKNEIYSFICHTLISLGEFSFAHKELKSLKGRLADDVEIEIEGHLYKMEAMLSFNNQEWSKSESLFKKSLDIMLSVNKKYVNEIIYNISNIYLLNDNLSSIGKYIKLLTKEDEYRMLVNIVEKISQKNKDDSEMKEYIDKIENIHLKSIANWYIASYYQKNNDSKNASIYINESQELLVNASEKISDWFQRENFLKNIYIHNEIMNFHDKIKVDFSDLDIDIEPDKGIDEKLENKVSVYKYCPQCGKSNENNYSFCIHCGNNLQI